jgi:hypothetical protein
LQVWRSVKVAIDTRMSKGEIAAMAGSISSRRANILFVSAFGRHANNSPFDACKVKKPTRFAFAETGAAD